MGRHGVTVVEVLAVDRGVEEHAGSRLVEGSVGGGRAGELGDVGVNLVEVAGVELAGVAAATVEAAFAVEFGVDDEPAVGEGDGNVGFHRGQEAGVALGQRGEIPSDVRRGDLGLRQVGAVEFADEGLKQVVEVVADDAAHRALGVWTLLEGVGSEDKPADFEEESVDAVVAVELGAGDVGGARGGEGGDAHHAEGRIAQATTEGDFERGVGEAGEAEEDGLEDLVVEDVGGEFVVRAGDDAPLEAAGGEGCRPFGFAAEGAEGLGLV